MFSYAQQLIGNRGDESLTLIDNYDEFHLSLPFDCSLYRPMCTHMNAGTILQT